MKWQIDCVEYGLLYQAKAKQISTICLPLIELAPLFYFGLILAISWQDTPHKQKQKKLHNVFINL